MSKFNFDFLNVDDLAPELKEKFVSDVSEQAKHLAEILEDPSCPGPLNITQLMAVYSRAFGPVPTAATFRAWLNKGVAAGIIHKPSKQFYAAGAGVSVADDSPEVDASEIDLDTDPLA